MTIDLLARMAAGGYETVAHAADGAAGLRAIIAVHDTTLGPALGGIRMHPYATEADALTDVLRLAEAMTYKAALAGLALGGGKAVVLGDPVRDKSEALFRALGRQIARLGGAYVATEDMGTTTADLEQVRLATRHAVGLPESRGGGGDPSPMTAWGVVQGIRAGLVALGERDALSGRTVAVQGVGKVGFALARFLVDAGATVVAADTDAGRAARVTAELGVRAVGIDDILFQPVDVVAPCAAGAVLSETTIPQLRCRLVAGGANNQLATDADGARLAERGVLYAPDFAVNAGGLINVADELHPGGYSRARARAKTEEIYGTAIRIFAEARRTSGLPHRVAVALASRRIEAARGGRVPAA